jgi:Na+/proline symporter
MGFGLLLAIFLISLLLVATSSWSQWRLKPEAPLDVDEGLPLPWAGYGSSTVSLSALFGAYTATLLVVGFACFAGVATGVILGLLLTNLRLRKISNPGAGFQSFLYSAQVFENEVMDRVFWLCLAFIQLGFATSELVLLRHVFHEGLRLPSPHSIAATLAIALVCYFYCLLAGYQAVFRVDVLQYIVLLVMCGAFLFLALFSQDVATLPAPLRGEATAAIKAVRFGGGYLNLAAPVRFALDFLVGLPLGMMPVIGAPDTWKRVFLLQSRRGAKLSSLMLLIAAGLPVALSAPLFLKLAGAFPGRMFPLQFLFSTSAPLAQGILLLGMTSAFMSTFDSAQISGVHLMLKIKPLLQLGEVSERQKYHTLMAGNFLLLTVLAVFLPDRLPHPYAVGVFLFRSSRDHCGAVDWQPSGLEAYKWWVAVLCSYNPLFCVGTCFP